MGSPAYPPVAMAPPCRTDGAHCLWIHECMRCVFCVHLCSGERQVQPAVKKSLLDSESWTHTHTHTRMRTRSPHHV